MSGPRPPSHVALDTTVVPGATRRREAGASGSGGLLLLAALAACHQGPPVPPPPWSTAGQGGGAETGGAEDTEDTDVPDDPDHPDHPGAEVDVVVVGAGCAGLAAAVQVASSGATVRVLEREDAWGGSAQWSGGYMFFSGSAEQAAAGVVDSPEALLADWPSLTGGDPDDPWVQRFAEDNVPLVRDWLAGFGMAWHEPVADDSTGDTPRVHEIDVAGGGLADNLGDELPIDVFRFGADVGALSFDGDGRVDGVTWTDRATGETTTTYAGAVVVATGGFLRDLDRVVQERPDLDGKPLVHGSWSGADGNGLTMLERAGAATQNLAAIGLYAHGTYSPEDAAQEVVPGFLKTVPWVNRAGERFVDESEPNSFRTGEARAATPGDDAWALYDATLAASATYSSPVPGTDLEYDHAEMVDAGIVVGATSLAALATALGVDGATLAEQIAAYDAFATGQADDPWRDDAAEATPVQTAPFYAVPVPVTVAKGFGGVDVDTEGRVLDTTGAPIPGLYAAGELTGMAGGSLVGDGGFTGSLTAVVLGGRVAGRGAVDGLASR